MKTGRERLASVTFTYHGTDQQFTQFLKMLIRDYLEASGTGEQGNKNCQ